MKAKAWIASLAVSALAWAVVPARAAPITFTGASGSRSASATFDTSVTNQLLVTLTNTSTADVLVPTDILTAVFFTLASPTLTPGSAVLAPGSSVLFDSAPVGGNVGGEWAYTDGLAAPNGANEGISSSGFGSLRGPQFWRP